MSGAEWIRGGPPVAQGGVVTVYETGYSSPELGTTCERTFLIEYLPYTIMGLPLARRDLFVRQGTSL